MTEDRALTRNIYTLPIINGVAGYYIHMLRRTNRRLITQLNRRAIIHNENPIVNAAPVKKELLEVPI